MRPAPRLGARQTQAAGMSPQLQQAIRLLQLSNLELAAFLESELEENPLLEREEALDEDDGASAEAGAGSGPGGDAASAAGSGTLGGEDALLDTDYANVWPDDPIRPAGAAAGDGADPPPGIEQTQAGEITLRDHLTQQLDLSIEDPTDRLIGRVLIDALDERGFMSASAHDLAGQLGCAAARVGTILETLQGFEPAGVFARDLAECLALQLAERDRLDPAMRALLDNLDLLAKHDLPRLRRACGVDEEDMADMLAELRSLNPRPAEAFERVNVEYVAPDVLMRPGRGGGWEVELNPATLPRVLANRSYYAEILGAARTKDDRAFARERFRAANWLVRALDRRAHTILMVAGEIVRQQEAFFRRGVTHLRPLVLADIAGAVDLHESTVSRVTANKYMATPRGLFELKYFFTTALGGPGGEAHSAELVRHKIRLLIEDESPKSVLSDDRIVEMLRGDGVEIARRTVAKYRDSLKIPSSVQRRRMKRAAR